MTALIGLNAADLNGRGNGQTHELVAGTLANDEGVQVYGRAEAATVSVLDWPGSAPAQDRRLRSAGRAPFGVDIAIQDDRGDHLPPGSKGEVCVKGLLVMSELYLDGRLEVAGVGR